MMNEKEIIKLLNEGENERVEFKKWSKTIFKELGKEIVAFANANGGFIFVGVDDHGSIEGVNIKLKDFSQRLSDVITEIYPKIKYYIKEFKINNKRIFIIKVEKSRHIVTIGNVAYIRVGKNKRILSLHEILTRSINKLELNYEASITDISANKIKSYLVDDVIKQMKLKNLYVDEHFLERKGFVKDGKLTYAGYLLFNEPNINVRIVKWFDENNFEVIADLFGNILELIPKTLTLVYSNIPKIETIGKSKRKITPIFPQEYVREAIINAFAHSNYLSEVPIYITFYNTTILEIKNPGPLPEALDLKKPTHIPRNPKICEILWILGYIERYGIGLKKLFQGKELGLYDLEIESDNFYTTLKFIRLEKNLTQRLLELLKEPKGSSEIAKFLGVSKVTAINYLNRLIKLKKVKKIGKGRNVKYVIA